MQEYRGRFNLPDELRSVPGSIQIEEKTGRIRLELDEPLAEVGRFELSSHPVVHGQLLDGSSLTLLGCRQARWGSPAEAGQTGTATYEGQFLLFGILMTEDERLSRISLSLTDLIEWLGQRGFEGHSDHTGPEPTFSARTTRRFLSEAETSRGLLRFHSGSTLTMGRRSAEFGTSASIEIVPEAEFTLSGVMSRYVRPLQDLLTIATGRPQDVIDLRVEPARKFRISEAPGDSRDWVEVRFARWSDQQLDGVPPFREQMLFSWADLDSSLAASLDSWFELDDDVHEVRTLATGPAYRPGMFLDQRFLYAVHALETYHRKRIGGQERRKEDHRRLIAKIVAGAPKDQRRWLKEKLAFSNELSLLARLSDLRKRLCERCTTVLGSIDHWEHWTRDTRNFNTHFTRSRGKARIAEGKQLLALTESLLLVLDDLILSELGLSDFARNELLSRPKRYRRLQTWIETCDWSSV